MTQIDAEKHNPTPQGTVARLATCPQYQPPGVIDEFDQPAGPTAVGLVRRGTFVAVAGRGGAVLGVPRTSRPRTAPHGSAGRWRVQALTRPVALSPVPGGWVNHPTYR